MTLSPKLFVLMVGILIAPWAGAQENFLRLGFFVGANEGGAGRTPLRYAGTDATAFAGVMQEVGALSASNTTMLYNPTPLSILTQLSLIKSKIAAHKNQFKRIEFLFYYSGHSDEEGLLLSQNKLSYRDLRVALGDLGADVQLAILDSCYSGAFTRLKGGVKAAPFLIDESSVLRGHAYLTSSSENEASQESDRIGGSFFTHYLISGLRGAADATTDGRVTLNEVYHHAFNETLARTEATQAGPQHPSYEIQLTGTGDLVLTDLAVQTSRLILGKELEGRAFIRAESGRLVAELQKRQGEQVSLALGPGEYQVTLQNDPHFFMGRHKLQKDQVKVLGLKDFRPAQREVNTTRGSDPDAEETSDGTTTITITIPKLPEIPFLPFFNPQDPAENQLPGQLNYYDWNWGIIPGLEQNPGFNKSVALSIHLLISQTAETRSLQAAGLLNFSGKFNGFQGAGLGNINTGSSQGFMGAGIFNLSAGTSGGVQSAGIFNLSLRDFAGIQTSGIFNIVGGNLQGVQVSGIFNGAKNVEGVQVSLVNKADDVEGLQVGLVNISKKLTGFSLAFITISDSAFYRYRLIKDTTDYLWNSLQWGQNQVFTTLIFGSRPEDIWNFEPEVMGATLGYQWGKELYFSVEGGALTGLPGTPQTLWQTWRPTLRMNGGLQWGPVGFLGGVGLEFFNKFWSPDPQSPVKTTWFMGFSTGI